MTQVWDLLDGAYGGERWHWMPGEVSGPFEIVAGAVLVQHTSWANAERALARLRADGALHPVAMLALDDAQLEEIVRVSGTPTVKARRLRALCETIEQAGGLDALLALPQEQLRSALLATHGVGRETADAIALYAAGHPAFVIDAYTRRTFRRLGAGPDGDSYEAWQRWFEDGLAPRGSTELYRRYHAYIVLNAKDVCRAVPRCGGCVLRGVCATGSTSQTQ